MLYSDEAPPRYDDNSSVTEKGDLTSDEDDDDDDTKVNKYKNRHAASSYSSSITTVSSLNVSVSAELHYGVNLGTSFTDCFDPLNFIQIILGYY